jgi:hypothetical protein
VAEEAFLQLRISTSLLSVAVVAVVEILLVVVAVAVVLGQRLRFPSLVGCLTPLRSDHRGQPVLHRLVGMEAILQ